MNLKSEMAKFAMEHVVWLKQEIKTELYDKSPLRNKFQVRPLGNGEIGSFKIKRGGFYLNECATKVEKVSGKKWMLIPLFEIACCPEFPYKEVKGLKQDALVEKFAKACYPMLKEETRLYKDIRRQSKTGKGIFIIRTDLQVLPANYPEKGLIGYSVFENVGIGILK